jgi:hypothetical protein
MSNDSDARVFVGENANNQTLISGWLSERFEKGEEPTYGYPKNHLPVVPECTMEVVTGFELAKEM